VGAKKKKEALRGVQGGCQKKKRKSLCPKGTGGDSIGKEGGKGVLDSRADLRGNGVQGRGVFLGGIKGGREMGWGEDCS